MQKSVLVVEADHETRVLIRKTYEAAGFFVLSCGNGADAVEMIDKITPPSFILLSNEIAINSGKDFLKKLRKFTNFQDVPIAQILAGDDSERLPGMSYYLKKPLSPSSLLAAVPNSASRAKNLKKDVKA